MIAAVAGLLLSSSGCAGLRHAPQTAHVEADIHLRPAAGAWVAEYALPKPAQALRFSRPDLARTRVRDWAPLDPAFELAADDGGEVLRRRDGRAFERVALAMPPRYVQLEKDYAPFSPFGDGGLLIHTGRLHACADTCAGDSARRWRIRVSPPEGAHAIVAGAVVREGDFIDADAGTNVYVGRARPVETPHVLAVIDEAMPAEVRARLTAMLPRLMDVYTGEFGPLATRPMLYASRDEQHPGGGYGYQGGTLPGQVFMHVYGRNEAFLAPGFGDRLDSFFAHEAAHLYQGYPALAEAGDAWIHEGGAEAMALLALSRLGVMDASAIRARVDEAAGACAEAIGKAPLVPLPATGRFDAVYACGLAVQMQVDSAARRATAGACDLFCVWRAFRARVEAGAPWSTDTFADAVAERVDEPTARFVREAVTTRPADPAALLRNGAAQR